jgi:hypothetical protein
MADPREEFSEKVLAKLKEMNKAVDLTEEPVVEEPVVEEPVVEETVVASVESDNLLPGGVITIQGKEYQVVASAEGDYSFQALGVVGGGAGPGSGGSRDILIIPGYGGTSSETASQINFYWDYNFGTTGYSTFTSTGLPSNNTDTGKRTSIINYADNTTNPALVIGGYNGTSWYGPTTTYGGITGGLLAPIWIHPIIGQIDTNYVGFNSSSSLGTSTIAGVMQWSGVANRLIIGDGAGSKTIAYTSDVTAANQLVAVADAADTDLYPLFVNLLGDGVTSQIVKTGTTQLTLLMNGTNGNVTIAGDVAVNGGDITTGTTATVTLFNTNASFTNAFGSSMTVTMGAPVGTTIINSTTVSFPNATILNMNGANPTVQSSATGTLTLFNNNLSFVNAFGSSMTVTMGAPVGTTVINSTTVTLPNATVFNINGANPSVQSAATGTLSLFNSNLSFVNAFGSSMTVTMGAPVGTTVVRSTTVSFSNATIFNIDGASPTISNSGAAGTLTLFNTNIATVNAFGSSASVTLGAPNAGTATINNATFTLSNAATFNGTSISAFHIGNGVTGASTYNVGTGATGAATKTINIGTNGGASATTNIALGTTAGTATLVIDTPTVTTNNTTLTLFNTTATTISAFGNASNLMLGNASGTSTIRNVTVTFTNASTLISGVSALTIFQEPSTITAYAGATTGSIFGTTASATFNVAAGATASNLTKTINIGTGGTALSTTNITIGGALNTANNTISFNLNRLQSVQDPTSAQDAATKNYVDNAIQGLDIHESVVAMATTAIDSILYYQQFTGYSTSGWNIGTSYIEAAANGALATSLSDGVLLNAGTVTSGDRFLITFGGSNITYNIGGSATTPIGGTSVINGVYVLTSAGGAGSKWRFDRAQDLNDNIEYEGGTFVWVQKGGTYADSGWVVTSDSTPTLFAIGSTAINWSQFSGAGAITAGLGLTKTGSTIDIGSAGNGSITILSDGIEIASTWTGSTSITTLGTIATGTWSATTIAANKGGTGTTAYGNNQALLYWDDTTNTFKTIATGATTTVLRGTGAGSLPSFGQVGLTSQVTGILPILNGGTATSTFATNFGVAYYTGANLQVTGAATTNQLLLSTSSLVAPAWATLTGDVTLTGQGTTVIGAARVLDSMLRNSGANSVIGRSTNSAGAPADISATTDGTVLRLSGTTLGFGALSIGNTNAVTGILLTGNGGTGTSVAPTTWGVVFGNASNVYQSTGTSSGASQTILSVSGGAPVWGALPLTASGSSVTGILGIANGGTATSAFAIPSGLVYYNGSNLITTNTTASGVVVTSAAYVPSVSTDIPTAVTIGGSYIYRVGGTDVSLADGGTNASLTAASGGIVYSTPTALAINTAGSVGQALVGQGTSAPTWGTLGVAGGGTGQTSFNANSILYAPTTTSVYGTSSFTWIQGTTSGTGSASAVYVNPASLTTGTAVNINVPSGATGKMIVGQLNGADKFSIDFNGNLRATTKSFDIEHPTKPGKRLVYGVLEGPEHGVYHRGTVEGKGILTVELPEYWSLLVGEMYSIQLTPWGNYSVHICDKTANNFTVQLTGNIIAQKFKNIKVDYIVHGSRLDAPLEIEQD